MLNSLPSVNPVQKDVKVEPSSASIAAILNYSKSIEVKSVKDQKILIHLN